MKIGYYNFYSNKFKVDTNGVVYGLKGKPLKQYANRDGYLEVMLYGYDNEEKYRRYKVKVHTIVAKTFLKYPNDGKIYEVNHKDCNRKNNKIENLESLTHYDNVKYSINLGRHKTHFYVGKENIKAKLLEEDVLKIRKLFNNGMSIREIYLKYYKNIVTENAIGQICNRKTWKHI